MTPPDFLSFCPSLLDALSLLDHADIPNCKLVSRRFRDVIKNNPTSIGREEISILFRPEDASKLNRFGRRGEYRVLLRIKSPGMEFELYENGMRVFEGNDVLKEHFERKGVLKRPLAGLPAVRKGRRYTEYSFRGHFEGLRTVLSVLVRRYHFAYLCLSELQGAEFPTKWLEEIDSQIRRFGCRCQYLHLRLPSIDSTTIKKLANERTHVNCEAVSNQMNLASIDFWKIPHLQVRVSRPSLKWIGQISAIVKLWEQLDSSNSFYLEVKSYKFYPNYWIWSHRELVTGLLNDLQYSSVEFDQRHLDDETIEDFCVKISRKSDGLDMDLHYQRDARQVTFIVGQLAKSFVPFFSLEK